MAGNKGIRLLTAGTEKADFTSHQNRCKNGVCIFTLTDLS